MYDVPVSGNNYNNNCDITSDCHSLHRHEWILTQTEAISVSAIGHIEREPTRIHINYNYHHLIQSPTSHAAIVRFFNKKHTIVFDNVIQIQSHILFLYYNNFIISSCIHTAHHCHSPCSPYHFCSKHRKVCS